MNGKGLVPRSMTSGLVRSNVSAGSLLIGCLAGTGWNSGSGFKALPLDTARPVLFQPPTAGTIARGLSRGQTPRGPRSAMAGLRAVVNAPLHSTATASRLNGVVSRS